jgi:transposase
MMGKKEDDSSKLYYYGFSLSERIPKDHPLRIIKKVIDFNFVYKEVKDKYGKKGNVSVPPPVILKMMFLLFFYNVSSERELMRTIPLRLDWLWFLGYAIDDEVPHHSVLSKARKRWGTDLFYKFFVRIVEQCMEVGLVDGEKIFMDSSLIDANASNKSIIDKQSVEKYANERYRELEDKLEEKDERYISTTDPDAGVVKFSSGKAKPRYKEHRCVDERFGVITSSITTSGTVDDGKMFGKLIDTHEENTNKEVKTVVGDSKYGTVNNYLKCKDGDIKPHLKDLKFTQEKGRKKKGIFSEDEFKYDENKDTFICPAGKRLIKRTYHKNRDKWEYMSFKKDCEECPLRNKCTTSKSGVRTVHRHSRQKQLDEMRAEASSPNSKQDLKKRWSLMERSFADGSNLHGLKKSRWRGHFRVQIQNHMISAVQNIRILIKHTYLDAESGQMAKKNPEKGKLYPINLYLIFILAKIWSSFRKNQNIFKYAN